MNATHSCALCVLQVGLPTGRRWTLTGASPLRRPLVHKNVSRLLLTYAIGLIVYCATFVLRVQSTIDEVGLYVINSVVWSLPTPFLVALLVAKPYKRAEDNVLALASNFALALFFFFSVVLR